MNIGKVVREAINKMMARDEEHALIQAMIAVDATAKLTYQHTCPGKKNNGKRFQQFVNENMELLTRVTFFRGAVLRGTAFFQCKHPELAETTNSLHTLGEILYGLRCHLLHEARLPDYVQLTEESKIQAGNPLILTTRIVYGLLAIVIAAPVNGTQYIPPNYTMRAGDKVAKVADFWGAGPKLLNWYKSA